MVGRDILVNFLGRSWAMLMGMAFVPAYLSFLGAEAYGLVGFYATLQAVLIIADFGLSWTVTRELAQARAEGADTQRLADIVRTMESAYWLIALLAGGVVAIVGFSVAERWFRVEQLGADEISGALGLMGAVFALQMPALYYQGVLNGMDRQPTANAMSSLSATLRWAGAALVLWWIQPSIQAFFLWQVVAAGVGTILMAWAAWRQMPGGVLKGRFDARILSKVGRFALGVMASAFAGVLAMQVDKLVLSRLIPLEQYGYYALAVLVTSLLTALVIPLHTAFYPRFSRFHATGDGDAIARLHALGTQLLAVLVVPAASILIFFPQEVLRLWTGDASAAQAAGNLVSLLAAGNLLYALSGIANLLLIAAGWPALSAIALAAMAAAVLPALVVFVPSHGPVAAGIIWAVACLCYLVVVVPATHRRLLGGHLGHWCLWSVLMPVAWSIVFFGAARWLLPGDGRPLLVLAAVSGAWLVSSAAIALSAPALRHKLAAALSMPLKAA